MLTLVSLGNVPDHNAETPLSLTTVTRQFNEFLYLDDSRPCIRVLTTSNGIVVIVVNPPAINPIPNVTYPPLYPFVVAFSFKREYVVNLIIWLAPCRITTGNAP
eukprot:NODE_502_length_7546_cov_0.138982.p8 type:complete len:104 gc:universal NODE_502_length_7546_cov_0.138982:7167-6856(-)